MKTGNPRTHVLVGFCLLLGAGLVSGQDWPQWRGPNRDNKVTSFTAPTTWPKELMKKWRVKVGLGESSPVLVREKLYVFGRQDGDEVILCLDAGSGKELWKEKYAAAAIKGSASGYPGPRSTPAVADGKICTLGVHGVVSCLDAQSGQLLWRKETGSKPQFYTSSSPLIADGKCIVFVNGLTAYDLATGESKWTWTGAKAPYGSPVLMTVDGTTQIVTPAVGNLAGIRLDDGKQLWQVKIGPGGMDYQHNFSTPLIDGNTVIYSIAVKGKKGGGATGAGTIALKIDNKDDGFSANEMWKKTLAAHQYHTPVLRDGLVYGVSLAGRNFFCVDAKTGEQLWMDKDHQRGQCGSILNAGSVLLALTADRELIAFKPSRKSYEEVAKYEVANSETWAVPIVAGNRIFVKDKGGSLTLWTLE